MKTTRATAATRRALFCTALLALAAGAAVFADEGANAALFAAAKSGTAQDVRSALNAGADVNARGENNFTALITAAVNIRNPDAIKELIKAGADVNAKADMGVTALLLACAVGNFDAIRVLVAAGANVNHADATGRRAVDYLKGNPANAKAEGYWEILELLY